MKRFVITGAPGAGKTAIIRELELDGLSVVEEAATDVIAAAHARGTTRQVFFVRTLGFITPTESRRISFEDAVRFEKVHEETYRNFGFELISVEPASVMERVRTSKAAASHFSTSGSSSRST